MDSTVLVGFAKVIAISLVPVAIMGAVVHLAVLRDIAVRVGRHVPRPARPPEPARTPIEELAATLRRLQPLAHDPQPGVRMAKYRGIVAAYDGRLVEAARVLEVPTSLAELPESGFDRDAERLRLEYALAEAGLRWMPPARGC